jgi:hypothetical protein
MCQLIPYIRTAEGHIERISFAIYNAPDDVLEPYVYEERLVGWPESKVFWAKESGASIGVAPMLSSPAN